MAKKIVDDECSEASGEHSEASGDDEPSDHISLGSNDTPDGSELDLDDLELDDELKKMFEDEADEKTEKVSEPEDQERPKKRLKQHNGDNDPFVIDDRLAVQLAHAPICLKWSKFKSFPLKFIYLRLSFLRSLDESIVRQKRLQTEILALQSIVDGQYKLSTSMDKYLIKS